MERTIFHIDMDAFYASVEQLDDPGLRGKPVVVGGTSNRSVVSAASYESRKYGIRSAMPMYEARRRCPRLVVLPVRMSRYKEFSCRVMAILQDFSPVVEQASVDEAYLDATGSERLFGAPRDMALALKDRVREETGLTCSVGVAPNKFLAKVASDMDKPDGLFVIESDRVAEFMASLDVSRIPGVGGRTLETLRRFGVKTAGDVLRRPQSFWKEKLGDLHGQALCDRARGIHRSPVVPYTRPKSTSAETTFEEDTLDRAFLERRLLGHAERVGADLRRHGAMGRTVTLKVKYKDFRQVTRSRSLADATASTDLIYRTAVALLEELDPQTPIRLIGAGVSSLTFFGRQLSLVEEADHRREDLDRAVDKVREKFGFGVVKRGRLLE